MSPVPNAVSRAALAQRYGVAKPTLAEWLAAAAAEAAHDPALPTPPEWGIVEGTNLLIVAAEDWDAYEAARRALGLPMPGERRIGRSRGPDRRPRPRRGVDAGEQA